MNERIQEKIAKLEKMKEAGLFIMTGKASATKFIEYSKWLDEEFG